MLKFDVILSNHLSIFIFKGFFIPNDVIWSLINISVIFKCFIFLLVSNYIELYSTIIIFNNIFFIEMLKLNVIFSIS